jgi:hypothetical protein
MTEEAFFFFFASQRRKPSKPCAWLPQAASASEPQQHYYQEQEPAPDPLLIQRERQRQPAEAVRASQDNLGPQERLQRIDFLTEILMSTIL